jgi:hypothetical protein
MTYWLLTQPWIADIFANESLAEVYRLLLIDGVQSWLYLAAATAFLLSVLIRLNSHVKNSDRTIVPMIICGAVWGIMIFGGTHIWEVNTVELSARGIPHTTLNHNMWMVLLQILISAPLAILPSLIPDSVFKAVVQTWGTFEDWITNKEDPRVTDLAEMLDGQHPDVLKKFQRVCETVIPDLRVEIGLLQSAKEDIEEKQSVHGDEEHRFEELLDRLNGRIGLKISLLAESRLFLDQIEADIVTAHLCNEPLNLGENADYHRLMKKIRSSNDSVVHQQAADREVEELDGAAIDLSKARSARKAPQKH